MKHFHQDFLHRLKEKKRKENRTIDPIRFIPVFQSPNSLLKSIFLSATRISITSHLGPNSRIISSAPSLIGLLETCFRGLVFLIENGLDKKDILPINQVFLKQKNRMSIELIGHPLICCHQMVSMRTRET